MKNLIFAAAFAAALSGCGAVDRASASLTGSSTTCVTGKSGKSYSVVQMASGAFYEMVQTDKGPSLVECK